jgi:hypothetical protein
MVGEVRLRGREVAEAGGGEQERGEEMGGEMVEGTVQRRERGLETPA